MQVIVISPDPSRRDLLVAELWEQGTVGILEEGSLLRAYFPSSVDVSEIVKPEYGHVIECRLEDDDASYEQVEANCEPVPLGRRFVVLSASVDCPASGSRIPLFLANSEAFGSGRHESTQLMVEAMEAYLQPGTVTIDVGCGSGILCEVARHLGAATVIACDSHTDSVRIARQTSKDAALFVGSADAIEACGGDLVLANISAKVIDILAADLIRITKPDGLLLLSGFIQDRTPERFRPESTLERNGWLCWICRPELLPAGSAEAGRMVQPFETQWW